MLSKERIDSLLYKKHIIIKPVVKEIVKDSLFWIFYKLFDVNYEKYPDFELESKIKFELLSKFQNKKDLFKQYKLKKEHVENDLIYNKAISMIGFVALCLYYNINVIITNKNTYYPIGTCDCKESKFHVVSYKNNNFNILSNNLLIFENKYKLPFIDKSMHVISKYKVTELKEIAKLNDISINGNKGEIYETLKNNITPLNKL